MRKKCAFFFGLTVLSGMYLFGQVPNVFLTSNAREEFEFTVSSFEENVAMYVDWGNGHLMEYLVGTTAITVESPQPLDGVETQIRIYCNSIQELDVSFNRISFLDISSSPTLEVLNCSYNLLSELDISSNPELKQLVCSENKLTSLSILANSHLQSLNCSQNQLTHLKLNSAIEVLQCGNNLLTELDLTLSTELRDLRVAQNKLAEINLKSNPHLVFLNVSFNPIVNIDLSTLSMLDSFWASSCSLTALDVTNNPLLETLSISNNEIVTIDLQSNPGLKFFYANHNKLSSLDCSGNPELSILYCHNNELTDLNLSACTLLERLLCFSNKLNTLDLSMNIHLWSVWIYNNRFTLATLPPRKEQYRDYYYGDHEPMTVRPVGRVIDLSDQSFKVNEQGEEKQTYFTWKTTDGVTIHPGIFYTVHDGVFTFIRRPEADIYCVMMNYDYILLNFKTEIIPASSFVFESKLFIPEYVVVLRNGVELINQAIIQTGDELVIDTGNKEGYTLHSLQVNGADFPGGGSFMAGDEDVHVAVQFKKNYFITMGENISVTRYGVHLVNNSIVHEGDELIITTNDPDNTAQILVNDVFISSGGSFIVGEGNVYISKVSGYLSESPQNFGVFPNPFDHEIYIVNQGCLIQKVELLNQNGKVVHSEKKHVDRFENLLVESGLYFIRITTHDNVWVKKVVKR